MDLSTAMQPLIIIVSALLGLLLGYATGFGDYSVYLIEPFLMILLFFVFLSVDGRKIRQAFRDVKFTLTALSINFLWTPIFAFLLGRIFFPNTLDLQIGLVMLLVTPCTDWYLVFTAMAKGNVELGASILPLNLLMQILLLPVYLMIFFHGNVELTTGSTVLSILFVLILPFGCAFLLKRIRVSFVPAMVAKLIDWGDNLQLAFLCFAVISMFASESKDVFENPGVLLRMLIPMILFFVVNFLLVRFVGNVRHMSYADITALNFTTLARNSPLSLAIAVAAFPQRPLISLALVIGPLIELPALGVIAGMIQRIEAAAIGEEERS